MAQTRVDAKVGGWFAAGYSCVSMDRASHAKFRPGLALCPHGDTCPGCPLLDLNYPDQLAYKFELVRAELSAYGELAALQVEPLKGAPAPLQYRTRAKLVAAQGALGLYARGTHTLLDIPHCRAFDPLVAEAVSALRGLLARWPVLAGVDVARAGARLLVTLIADEAADEAALRALAEALMARCPAVAGVASTRRARDAVQLLAAGHALLCGESALRVQSDASGPYHYLAFGAFLQAHAEVARLIYETLAARLFAQAPRPRVLELYAGSGSLAASLAARGAEVVAVESYGPACERLTRAAHEQGLSISVVHADAAAALAALRARDERFDVALVNPPRRGLAPEVRLSLAALAPAAIGYVSCRPSTLARDLAHFARLGFAAARAEPFDMMPMTEQVETLVWLQRRACAPLSLVAEDERRVVVEKPPFMDMDELTQKVRARCAQVTPELTLSARASGLVSFARGAAVPSEALPPVTFLVLARGVLRARGKLGSRAGASVHYQRSRVVSGHSLLRVVAPDEAIVRKALAAIGHPVLGDAKRDRESARHFALRHGLDRSFLHLTELSLPAEHRVTSALAPDLAAVLRSLAARDGQGD
jgi:23S rRNA (uracil1939-C5)-methyltransferase